MKFIKPIMSAVMLAITASVCNAETLYLHALDSSGNWVVFNLDKVDRLEYKNGGISFSDKQGNEITRYEGDKLTQLQISEDAKLSGIENITDTLYDKAFSMTQGNIVCSEDGIFQLFDVSGKLVVSIPEYKAGQGIDLGNVASGIYVAKINNKNIKIRL